MVSVSVQLLPLLTLDNSINIVLTFMIKLLLLDIQYLSKWFVNRSNLLEEYLMGLRIKDSLETLSSVL